MATRRDDTAKPTGPANARMVREGGPKDESGTPFQVRGEQQSPGKRRGPSAGDDKQATRRDNDVK